MTRFSQVTAALRRKSLGQYALLTLCCFVSVLLITAYASMMGSPTVLSVFPEGGDSRKQMTMIFVLAVLGCGVFTTYASGLFFRHKSRDVGILLALGASKDQLRRVLTGELTLMSLSACALGALLGTPLAWFIWQGFRLLLVDSEEMALAFDSHAYLLALAFSLFVVVMLFVMLGRFLRRTNILDVVNESRKSEPIRAVPRWYGPLGIILLAAGGVALFALRRINRYVLTGLLAGVMLLDLVPVDLRFLSSENFVSPRRNQVTASAADKAIMQDKDPGYRVLNLTVSPFNDATTSYFHRSVGGYHGAKLARYQDLIDRYLSNADDGVLDMLNTRYLIVPGKEGQPEAQRRTTAFGAAWFVDSVIYAPSAQAEIDLLGKTDLRTTAVVSGQNPAKSASRPMPLGIYASARIELTEYRPNYLKYEYTLPEEAVAVFSEIFFPSRPRIPAIQRFREFSSCTVNSAA